MTGDRGVGVRAQRGEQLGRAQPDRPVGEAAVHQRLGVFVVGRPRPGEEAYVVHRVAERRRARDADDERPGERRREDGQRRRAAQQQRGHGGDGGAHPPFLSGKRGKIGAYTKGNQKM